MLPLLKLTVLCGLLVGPSCCLLDLSLPGTVGSLLNTGLSLDLKKLLTWDIPSLLNKVKQLLENGGNLVGDALKDLLYKMKEILNVKFYRFLLLKIEAKAGFTPLDASLKVPASAIIDLKLGPNEEDNLKVDAFLEVFVKVKIETDLKTGRGILIFGECYSDAATLSLSVLEGKQKAQNNFIDFGIVIKKTISSAMEAKVCSILKQTSILKNVSTIKELISNVNTQTLVGI
ncbi:short palate, lung and nasal epithelium carcinoma-associated protein 2A [Monodelphis domestica]|uniref:short palate, lung and nasal epithelium carcinoma-associated protein 2A n=1 Tax=Monodelphis domestica TaxID=13616 RepID=UPI0024E21F93|nr:short palate, lung and nasal epithelium carcinoma-associated protein 2A [Monodelphis domestica]